MSDTRFDIKHHQAFSFRLAIVIKGREVAHAYMYLLHNDLHDQPFALLEDLFVKKSKRRAGFGKMLVSKVLEEARSYKCYKIIATSRQDRPHVHEFYQQLGFIDYGKEFRIDL